MSNIVEVFGWRYELVSDIKRGDGYEITLRANEVEVKMYLTGKEFEKLNKVKFITHTDLEEEDY